MIEARPSFALLFIGLLALVAIAAASLAPHDRYFFGNFVFYWLPAALVLAVLIVAGAGLAVATGSAAALTAFLFAYHAWAYSVTVHEWVWGGYLFAMPGAVAGGLVASVLCKRGSLALAAAAFVGVAATAAGLALNVGLVCVTIMNCRG